MKKIVAFTDIHGDVQDAKKVLDLAIREKPDVIVCSGDFSLFGNRWRAMLEILRVGGRRIFVVGGNHESAALMTTIVHEYPFIVDVSYTITEERGVQVGGAPGYDKDFFPSNKSDDDVVAMARDIWSKRDTAKPFVFLTHFPPAGAVDGLSNPTPDAGGSATVRAIIRTLNPDLVVTGHYHQEFGCIGLLGDVPVVNPGPAGNALLVASRRGHLKFA